MSERFFVATPVEGNSATLSGAEAHHLTNVLRASVSDLATLFDGSGDEFVARIRRIGKGTVSFDIERRRSIDRESAIALTLAVALPKGDRQRWLIEKSVELGVARLVPLFTQRGVAQPADAALTRLRRGVIEASKQCGRNRLMEIAEPRRLDELKENSRSSLQCLIAHPGGQPISQVKKASTELAEIVAAIGPEGGFTDEELASATSSGWAEISLGPRILRVETAAIAVAAWASLA
ncbi:MAG: 16S rRNA (uracil(1498)-N(3))-methyltransferase [Pirellulales bacterium]|nr:16S rRNA (uracil(1498)-N(3))-methyltransferase [Pirellulales bacterium]